MLAVNKIDTDVNNGVSYKKHIEVLQEQLDYLKGEIIEKNKNICNLTSAMTKNPSTPLQGSKSLWLPSAKGNEFINQSTSTPPLCLDANTPKRNFLKNPLYNKENYKNLLHSDKLLNFDTVKHQDKRKIKIKTFKAIRTIKTFFGKTINRYSKLKTPHLS